MSKVNERIDPETGEVMEMTATPMGNGQTAGDIISQGAQLLQIRTKNQLMVAIQRPRDMKRFESQLLAMAAEAGEDFFYSIPFKNRKEGTTTMVEGPGVGLARSAAQLWGNCSVDTRIEQETNDNFLVRTDFVDFETNFTRSETKRVSKLMPKYGGGTRLAAGKELDLVYQQGASKVERDCILRSLPKHIIERSFETAKAAALAEKDSFPVQINRILRRFTELNVGIGQLEVYLGHAFTEDAIRKASKDPREVCAHLRGLITAIKGGDVSIEEAFGQKDQQAQAPASQQAGSITPGDLTTAKAAEPPFEADPPATTKATNSPPQSTGRRAVKI